MDKSDLVPFFRRTDVGGEFLEFDFLVFVPFTKNFVHKGKVSLYVQGKIFETQDFTFDGSCLECSRLHPYCGHTIGLAKITVRLEHYPIGIFWNVSFESEIDGQKSGIIDIR